MPSSARIVATASGRVHPMASNGQIPFIRLTPRAVLVDSAPGFPGGCYVTGHCRSSRQLKQPVYPRPCSRKRGPPQRAGRKVAVAKASGLKAEKRPDMQVRQPGPAAEEAELDEDAERDDLGA